MKKIFPFYKGENLSKTPLGYSNVTNARKRMDLTQVKKDFDETLPKDYWLDYYYIHELDNKWDENMIFDKYDIRANSHFYCNICIYTKGYVKRQKLWLKSLDKEMYDLFIELHNIKEKIIEDHHNKIDTDQESYPRRGPYKNILIKILKKGYLPTMWKDDTDYKKRLKKFIDNNVDFKEMEVDVILS